MKRSIGLGCIILAGACGSSENAAAPSVDGIGFAPDDPTSTTTNALSGSLARNITIDQISAFQVVEVPLAKDGARADRTITGLANAGAACTTSDDCTAARECSKSGQCLPAVKLIAKRAAVLRIFVTPGPGWQPTTLTARVKIRFSGPTGSETRVVYNTKLVTKPSTMAELDSTINVDLPGDTLEPSATFGVVLNQVGGDAATPKSTSRYPMDGSLDDLAVVGGADVMHLQLVPIVRGGGDPVPDTSPAKLKSIADRFMQLYPIASIDLTVHAPYTLMGSGGNDVALMEINNLHGKDGVPSSLYYYGVLNNAGGGLSGLGPPASVGDNDAEVMAHEVGHAHGLQHAPYCGAPGTPPNYWPADSSHEQGHLGRWVYDFLGKTMIDPSSRTDILSYCPNKWISDFHYMRFYMQVRGDNRFYGYHDGLEGRQQVPSHRGLYILSDGSTQWSTTSMAQSWITRGEPQVVLASTASGTKTGQGYYFPYDHLPGGILMVSEETLQDAITVKAPALSAPVVVEHANR